MTPPMTAPAMRMLGPGDAPACAALHARAMDDAWSARDWAATIDGAGVVALGAGEPPAGAVLARVAGAEAEIVMLAVDPPARRRGLARTLLDAALVRLSQEGARQVFLEVAEDNAAALALYRAFGFVDAGRRVGYYARSAGRVDALVLKLDRARPGS